MILSKNFSPPGFVSELLYKSLKAINFSEKVFTKMLTKPDRGTNQLAVNKINKKLSLVESYIDGFRIITVSGKTSSNKHIIFLHGGAYFAEPVKGHRQLVERLALSGFVVSFINYPLAPENNAEITIGLVEKAFNEIATQYSGDEFFLFGDSAGGGIALSLLQILRDNNHPKIPTKTVLVSPWLDISMSNTDISDYINKDVLLSCCGLIQCGKIYAQDIDLKDPKVSPIYGKLDGLSQIKIFVSDYELFYPDCQLLKQKLDLATGSSATLTIKEKMIHDWIVLPIKERKETIDEIVEFF